MKKWDLIKLNGKKLLIYCKKTLKLKTQVWLTWLPEEAPYFHKYLKVNNTFKLLKKLEFLNNKKLPKKWLKNKPKKNKGSVKPEESMNSERILIETKNSLNNNKKDDSEQVGKIKELKISRNKLRSRNNYLKIAIASLENKEKE